jgi:hypothetical protein
MDRALGLPPGTIASNQTTPSGSVPMPTGRPTAGSPKESSVPSTSSSHPQPNPTPDSVLRLVSLVWKRVGGLVMSSVVLYTIGWVWSTVLLVLGIHRLQQISPAAAIAVVFLAYAICITLILVMIFAFAGACVALISWAIHAAGAAGGAVHH